MTIDELLNWAKSKELSIILFNDWCVLKYKEVVFLKTAFNILQSETMVYNYNLLGGTNFRNVNEPDVPIYSYKTYSERLEKTTLNHLNYSLEAFKNKYDFLLFYSKKQTISKRKIEMSKDFIL